MRPTALLLALAVTMPVPAHAATPPGEGRGCGYVLTRHPLDPSRQVGEIEGGPYVIGDRTGRLTCSIQVNDALHAGQDALAVTSLTTTGVVALPLTPIELAADHDWLALCTQVEIDGEGTYYWDVDARDWSTDPGTAYCDSPVGPPPPDPPRPLLDTVNELVEQVVDPVLCPVLGGDVIVADVGWDCPPYED